MAIVSAVSTLTQTITVGTGTRQWVATAATQDTAAGSSVSITTTQTTSGTTPPVVATTLELRVFIDNHSLGGTTSDVKTFSLTPGSASQTSTFFFTDTGNSGGANRCGIIRIQIHAVSTTVGQTYDINSDNAGTMTFQTGYAAGTINQGWIRGTTTATFKVNKTAFTDAAYTGTYAYPDSVFIRSTLAAGAYFAASGVTASITNTVGAVLSKTAVGASAQTTWDTSFTASTEVVGNNFPVSSSSQVATMALSAPSLAIGGSLKWTSVGSLPTQTLTVDPRLTIQVYMQLNDAVVGTPPDGVTNLSHNVNSKLSSDVGEINHRVTNALGTGVNSVAFTAGGITVQDHGHLTTAISRAGNTLSTTTLGGADGWVVGSGGLGGADPNFMGWGSVNPSGTWDYSYVISTTNATGLATPASPQTLILLAPNPNLRIMVIGQGGTNQKSLDHWHAGEALTIAFAFDDTFTHTFIQPASPQLGLRRFNLDSNVWEFLRVSDLTWQPATGTLTNFDTTTSPALVATGDNLGYQLDLSAGNTAGWGGLDIVIVAKGVDSNGTPYSAAIPLESIQSQVNNHLGHEFDPTGLFK